MKRREEFVFCFVWPLPFSDVTQVQSKPRPTLAIVVLLVYLCEKFKSPDVRYRVELLCQILFAVVIFNFLQVVLVH